MSTMTDHDHAADPVATDRGQRPVPANASPDRYVDEIRQTRAAMDETLEEIAERFDPDRLMDDAWRWSRDRMPDPRVAMRSARGFGEDALVAIKRHPVPASIMGLGLVWMLSEVASGRSIEGSDIAGAARSSAEGVSRASREAGRRARSAYESAAETANHIGSEMGSSTGGTAGGSSGPASGVAQSLQGASRQGREAANMAGERAREAAHAVSDGARNAARSTSEAYSEHPLLFGLLAAAGGLVAGLTVPNTRSEQEALGDAGERLRREARRTGEEAAGEAIGRTVDAADEAVDRGLGRVEDRIDEAEKGGDSSSSSSEKSGAGDVETPSSRESSRETASGGSGRPAGSPGSPTRPWR